MPSAPPEAGWLSRVVEQASTLGERLGGDFVPVPGPASERLARARLERWRERVADGDERSLARRLAWDGLDHSRVTALLGEVRLGAGVPLPPWAELLGEVVDAPRVAVPGDADEGTGLLDPAAPLPFEDILLPFVLAARRRLARVAGRGMALLAPEARTGLERSLLRRLSALCAPPFYVELSALRAVRGPGGAYDALVTRMRAGGMRELLGRWPVLARMAASQAERWVEASAELARRVEEDGPLLAAAFGGGRPLGTVVEVRAGLSDPHRGGRTVAALRFASGARVVYKPRGLEMDEAWSRLLAWLADRGALPPLRTPAVASRGTHGWAAFVEPGPCTGEREAERYHERAGMLLSLAYALGGGDLHAENVVACREDPVLVDLEVLAAPFVEREAAENDGGAAAADRAVWESVLRTRLLPLWSADGDGPARREGGLTDPPRAVRERWRHTNTGWMVPAPAETGPGESRNLPCIRGEPCLAGGYVDAVRVGLARGWRALTEHRSALLAPGGPLEAFAGAEARLVLRHTRLYGAVLRRSLHPRLLASGVERSIELDVLCRPLLRSDTRPRLWPVMGAERRDLEAGDVPVFTARAGSTVVRDSAGAPLGELLDSSGLEDAARRLRGMNTGELEVQAQLVRVSFSSADEGADGGGGAGDALPPEGELLSPGAAGEEAVRIAGRLARLAYPRRDGSVSWVGIAPGAARFVRLDPSLHAGTSGIALFLAWCARAAGRDDLGELARRALLPVVRAAGSERGARRLVGAVGPGGATGAGGLVYALSHAGQVMGDEGVIQAAACVAAALRPRAGRDAVLDVHGGSAGAVLGLLALHAATGDGEALDRARPFGACLAKSLSGSGNGGVRALSVPGFAHGLAGIVCALERLHRVTGDDDLRLAADAGRDRLRLLLSSDRGWFAEVPDGAAHGSWCNGAAGVALGAVDASALVGEPDREMRDAALTMVAGWPLERTDHLCCGNLGRAECLLAASHRLGRPALRERAAALAGEAVRRAHRRRTYGAGPGDAYAPGLFQGLAGIGYAMLRLHDPARIPCVLLWE